ncbi:MAG: hypothetical protein WC865_15910 [Bacteroidales bacterium]
MKKILVIFSLLVFVGVYAAPALTMPKDVAAKIVAVDKDKKMKASKATAKKSCCEGSKAFCCKGSVGSCCGVKTNSCCGVSTTSCCSGTGECTGACTSACKEACGLKCEGKKAEEKKK